jgi:hypothetical protein
MDDYGALRAPWGMLSHRVGPFFGEDFVQNMRSQYAHRRPTGRPLSYDIAVGDEYEPWRVWLDEQLTVLPEERARKFANQLWPDQNFWPAMTELAVGASLRAAGYNVVHEHRWGGSALTPDWMVLDANGDPACLVEVHTDEPPRETYASMRAWHGLSERIAQIPVPVVLLLESAHGDGKPPSDQVAKRIARSLRTQLLESPVAARVEADGFRFVVAGDRWGRPLLSPKGLGACFEPPSSTAGPVSAERLSRAVDKKVTKYRHLADDLGVPLVVAVGAHRFTGVDLGNLDDLLAGRAAANIQFGAGDISVGKSITVDMAHIAQWTMSSDLSGVLWATNEFPFALTARPNATAKRPMPVGLIAFESA